MVAVVVALGTYTIINSISTQFSKDTSMKMILLGFLHVLHVSRYHFSNRSKPETLSCLIFENIANIAVGRASYDAGPGRRRPSRLRA